MAQTLRNSALLKACVSNSALLKTCVSNMGDIVEVVKTQRKAAPTVSPVIDGVNTNIDTHFAYFYKQLYNSVGEKIHFEG